MIGQPQTPSTGRGHLVFLLIVIVIELLLFFADRGDWCPINERKGWTALLCLCVAAGSTWLLLLWALAVFAFQRRFQFRIDTMLVFGVVVAIPCGWMATAHAAAERQREVVAACTEASCNVYYDDLFVAPGQGSFRSGGVESPWLYKWLGRDFFHELSAARVTSDAGLLSLPKSTSIHTLIASDSSVTDRGLARLEYFPNLRWLDLCDANQMTDAGIAPISELHKLECVLLRRTPITDAAMKYLENKRELRNLDVGMTDVSGTGLKHITQCTNLKELSFWANDLDDESLEYLENLEQLQSLDLGFATITDQGLQQLKKMKGLRSLGLRGTNVTDDGMILIANFSQLERLDIYKTSVGDAGLAYLRQLKALQSLYLGETRVTEAGVTRLQSELPGCKIYR